MATLTRTAPGASARRCRTWPLLLTGAAALLLAAAAGAEAPLFSSNDRLDFTLDLPLTTVLRKDPDNPKLEGQLRYLNDAGETVALPVTVTTRGRSRLETCRFPPLWLRFEKKTVRGTLFAKQRRLKLVTHCRDSDQYARYVQQEHGIYRAFNALTERSFRVRMLEITYRDTDRGGRSSTHPAFFIEHVDAAAKRLGREELKVERVAPEQLDGEHANLVDLFQFLIGNTDFSQLAGPPDDTCCHNGKVLGEAASAPGWIVLPYDFDQAGLINATYAAPAPELRLRSVRQRRFRGLCRHMGSLEANLGRFAARREAIEAALLPPTLQGFPRRAAESYVSEFYAIVADPRRRERAIERRCLGPAA